MAPRPTSPHPGHPSPPGRVKTLHPAVHGGILAIRDKADHMAAIAKHNIGTIDLVSREQYHE